MRPNVTTDGSSTLDALVDSLLGDGIVMSAAERVVALGTYRLLARGRPVDLAELAGSVRQDEGAVRAALLAWPDVFYEHGRIVGFWGLDLRETAHSFEVEGQELFTWCAWDPLFIAPILGAEGRVESRCPVTGRGIALSVGPGGVTGIEPPEAVLSFVDDHCVEGSVITGFCQFVLYFASEEAARGWVVDHPRTTVLSIDAGFELGQRMNAHRFGLVERAGDRPRRRPRAPSARR